MAPIIDWVKTATQLVLALSPLSSTPQKLPYINTTITPLFHSDGSASSLNISMVYENPSVKANDVFLTMPLVIGWLPTATYGEDGIKASDGNGPLLLKVEDVDNNLTRNYLSLRDTIGDVKIDFQALPREITNKTLPGPRVDLRTDQGGLIGNGIYFMPIIADKKTYNISLKWDLELAPEGTKAVWSFGDGESANRIGAATDLLSIYVVGPLNSYTSSIKEHNDFGVYWFGEPPFDANQLAVNTEKLYVDMQDFFKEEKELTFRVFLRKSTSRSFGGTGGERSFMYEFDDSFGKFEKISDLTVLNLLAHEMVHEYPLMEADMTAEVAYSNSIWYEEGIAVYYAAILPYLSNSYNRDEFIALVNSMASAYYTSPAINMSEKEALQLVATDSHAQRLPYYRGAMYLVKLDAELRASSNGELTLTDLVLPFLELKRQRKPYRFQEWLSLLESHLGESAVKDNIDMLKGKELIIPSEDSMSYAGLKLVREDQEPYESGLQIKDKKILKVIHGTRAAESGLQEGDTIEDITPLYLCADNFTRSVNARIRRGDEVKEFSYWPRAFRKVESYQWVSIEE